VDAGPLRMARQLDRTTDAAGQPPQLAQAFHRGGAGPGGSADAAATSAKTRERAISSAARLSAPAARAPRPSQVPQQAAGDDGSRGSSDADHNSPGQLVPYAVRVMHRALCCDLSADAVATQWHVCVKLCGTLHLGMTACAAIRCSGYVIEALNEHNSNCRPPIAMRSSPSQERTPAAVQMSRGRLPRTRPAAGASASAGCRHLHSRCFDHRGVATLISTPPQVGLVFEPDVARLRQASRRSALYMLTLSLS